MKVYFVAVRKETKTKVHPFTSFVKQRAAYKEMLVSNQEDEVWMYGPVDFPLGGKGIINALEYGIKSINLTEAQCDEDDYDCGSGEDDE